MTRVVASDASPRLTIVGMEDIYRKEIVAKRHNCTDVICLLIFGIFVIAQIILSIVIYVIGGDPTQLLLPYNSDGDMCTGSTPNLFYFNLAECMSISALVTSCTSTSICLANCPPRTLFYMLDADRTLLYSSYCSRPALAAYFGNASSVPTSVGIATYSNLIAARVCPAYTIQETAVYGRCFPSYLVNAANSLVLNTTSSNVTYAITDGTNPISETMLTSGTQYLINLLNVRGIAQDIFQDFLASAYLIALLFVIAAVVSFLYIFVMRWVVGPLIYFSCVAVIAGLGFATYYCFDRYVRLNGRQPSNVSASVSGAVNLANLSSATLTSYFSSEYNYVTSLSTTWLVAGIVAAVLLALILLVLLALFKRLRLAIQLICEASRATTGVFSTLLFPIVPLLIQMALFVYFVANAVILASAGKKIFRVANSSNSSVPIGSACSAPATTSTWLNATTNGKSVICLFYAYGFDLNSVYASAIGWLSQHQFVPQLFNLFMMFWMMAFVIGWSQMVLAGSFGIWYWSKARSSCVLVVSMKDSIVYHLGSIAFGSLLIAICKILRLMLSIVEKKLRQATGNNAQLSCMFRFISCCCKCCMWCLENFVKFINRNAYIMIAIYGRNFCTSARDALQLLLTNPLRALVLDRVTEFVLLLGRLMITCGVAVLAFFFFSKGFYVDPAWRKYFQPDLHYYWVPLATVIVITYFIIAKAFLTVFELAVDTIFLCAMKDLSLHDGSADKPYFMSAKLLKILNVTNKSSDEANKTDI